MPSPRRSPSSTRSATRSTEYVLAVAVATYADAIGVPLVASKNGAYSSARVGAAYKRMGVRAGFPDLNIPKVGGRDEPGLYVELKAPGRGLRANQREWQQRLRREGYVCEVVHTLEEFKELVANYLSGDGPEFERTVCVRVF